MATIEKEKQRKRLKQRREHKHEQLNIIRTSSSYGK
jgi:hypothetical protein